MEKNKVIVILGPTSTGKTSLSIRLCKEFNGSIISADSRQIFKKMDIGTGKIPINNPYVFEKQDDKWTVDGIDVYGYDLVYPNERYSSGDFSHYYSSKSKNVLNFKNIFLVGGTGFYIASALEEVSISEVSVNNVLRDELNKLSLIDLQNRLGDDINKLNESDLNNPRRLIRKIEIKESGCQKVIKREDNKQEFLVKIGLYGSNEYMFSKADRWVDSIWDNLVTEVKYLFLLGYIDTPPLNGLIYKTVKSYLSNDMSKEDSIERIKFDLHSYIRRQMTWFKKDRSIEWFNVESDSLYIDISNRIREII